MVADPFTYDAQVKQLREHFEQITDTRAVNCSYALPDLLMSVYAMFALKYESLLDFERQTIATRQNLIKLFGITKQSSDSCLRKVLDKLDWREIRHLFVAKFSQLKASRVLNDYQWFDDRLLVSIDGVEHFSSKKVHCDHCLTKKHKSGEITYSHAMLCAVIVHPTESEVFVIGTEPIQRQDGGQKNDCERNASKRLIDCLSVNYKDEKLVLIEDALYSTGPNIKQIKENNWDFILAVKLDSHQYLFRLLALGELVGTSLQKRQYKQGKERYSFSYLNDVSPNESHPTLRVNFLYCEQTNAKGKVTIFSWVTSILLTEKSVVSVMKAGRSRWKIENETFNTLKNQGYHFTHNYGHGQANLSNVFAHLMLLAFLTDQLVQRCNQLFRRVWSVCGTKLKLWFGQRASFFLKEYLSFEALYVDIGRQFTLQF